MEFEVCLQFWQANNNNNAHHIYFIIGQYILVLLLLIYYLFINFRFISLKTYKYIVVYIIKYY